MTVFPVPPRDPLRTRISRYLGLAPKDWVTLSISALALIISVVSAYFNTVRRIDHVSLVFASFPAIHQIDADNLAITDDASTLAFINSGTRSAAITSLNIFVLQHSGPSQCDQTSTGAKGTWFATTLDPLAIKSNEVAAQKVKISHPWDSEQAKRNEKGWYVFPLTRESKENTPAHVEVCYAIFVATPSVATHAVHVSGIAYDILGPMTQWPRVDPNKPPIELLRSWGTIFNQ